MEVATTSHIIHEPAENGVAGKAEKKSGKRIGYNYIILKSLKESEKNDVVKCLYIKSLTNFGVCVIKEGTYGDSKDKDGRDIRDKLLWQRKLHQELQDKVRIPRLIGSFEENGNYYLVLERIKGKSLYKTINDKNGLVQQGLINGTKLGLRFLESLIQLVGLLENLHKNHVVHRDVSAANFMIMPNGKVALIDMELSYSLDKALPSPPFQLGTYGYMSPEQEAMDPPAVEQDIFSVGAILLQAWTSISPIKLTNAPIDILSHKVYLFVTDKILADTIINLLHTDYKKRPSLCEVREVIQQYKEDLRYKRMRQQSAAPELSKVQITGIIQKAIYTLASPLLADAQRGWFSEDIHAEKNADKRKINKAWYTSFNSGAAGVLYLLSHAYTIGFDTNTAATHIEQALALVENKYINRIDRISSSLYFGSSGIAASLAIALKHGLIEPQTNYFEWISRLMDVDNSKLNIMNGIAGHGMAYWHCQPFINEKGLVQRLSSFVQVIMNSQQHDGSFINEIVGKKKKFTRGFARGVAGNIYFLLEYGRRYNNNEALIAAERGLNWLIKKARQRKGTVLWLSSGGKEIDPWWCEGGPGIALTFLKAYSILDRDIYKEYARRSLYIHSPKTLNNNLSQCHGLSGLGEIYLEAWKVLAEEEWLERAGWIAQAILQLRKEHEQYGPYWLVEHERHPVADFMIGNSGVIHFLLRYCYPDKLCFPLLSI